MLRCAVTLLALAFLMAPIATSAQTTDQSAPSGQPPPSQPAAQAPPAQAPPAQVPAAQAPAGPPPTQPEQPLLKPEQLEALAAPIALYPDELLANVLAASTYPLEIVQADRWVKANKNLKGDAQKAAVDKQAWDDSVKALVSTPDVLAMMSDKIDWTKNLGDAVLAQQPDVMDAVQRLRAKAQKNNKLVTNKQQKVSVQKQQNKEAIVIEPAQPGTIYVPYYDPATVYGAWPYASYPPYYFGYPSYIGAGVIAAGLAFGAGWAIGRWGNYWGGGVGWGNNNFYVNHRSNTINNWQHNPAHRQGVRYNNGNVANRFGNNSARAGVSDRMNYRGRDGQGAGNRAGDRAGDRGGDRGGDRAGNRGGDRPGAADRSKGGDRAGAGDRAKGGGDRAGNRGGGDRAGAANRARGPAAGGGRGGGRDSALGGISSGGRAAGISSARGQMSLGGRGGGGFGGGGLGGGGFRGGGGFGGGGFRGGGGGFRGGGGFGGRRSDIALKHDIVLLGHLDNGLGYYRFSYLGSHKAYVGVMAQEVQGIRPDAVTRGSDGFLRVYYDKLGLKFRSYHDWLAAGGRIPTRGRI